MPRCTSTSCWTSCRSRVSSGDFFVVSFRHAGQAGSRPGGRPTFFAGAKKVGKESTSIRFGCLVSIAALRPRVSYVLLRLRVEFDLGVPETALRRRYLSPSNRGPSHGQIRRANAQKAQPCPVRSEAIGPRPSNRFRCFLCVLSLHQQRKDVARRGETRPAPPAAPSHRRSDNSRRSIQTPPSPRRLP